MKVKICGLQEIEHVQAAVQSGADYIGFVFAPSKRRISLKQAKSLASVIPENVKIVGVFVNPTYEEVITTYERVPLDVIQLHGSESPEFTERFSLPVVKAFKVINGIIPETIKEYTCPVLLDAPSEMYEGGSGNAFDWHATNTKDITQPIIIAGGLTSRNVQEAIHIFQPFAVDVSSGVETNGKKDTDKIKQFIASAKGEL